MELIMTNTDAIICAMTNGIPELRKRLQRVADVSNGGKLSDLDNQMLSAAEDYVSNKDNVGVARYFQRQIQIDNRLIKERDAEIARLQRRIAELECDDGEDGVDA